MNASLIGYFNERLENFRDSLGADWVGIFQRDFSESLLPLVSSGEPGDALPGSAIASCATSGMNVFAKPGNVISAIGGQVRGLDPRETAPILSQGAFPIVFGNSPLGVLGVESIRENFFTNEKILSAEALCHQLAALWDLPSDESAIFLDRKMEWLKASSPFFDWCGVYRLVGDTLYLTAFRGAPTPHPVIQKESGICGAAVRENRTLNIADVKSDARYLSCDGRTRSELVVPIRDAANVAIGEIDIDSYTADAFGPDLVLRVEELARALSPLMVELT